MKSAVIILIGVAGSGKSTLGKRLAKRLGFPFLDADTLHPTTNIDKMKRGEPLNDDDRYPWLATLAAAIIQQERQGLVVACSALKQIYRDRIDPHRRAHFFLLKADPELLKERLHKRQNHFFPTSLLASQLKDLEEDRCLQILDATQPLDRLVERVCAHLHL